MPETLSERDLIEAIFSDDTIRDAVTHLVCNMQTTRTERARIGHVRAPYNARYEIVVTGRQVSSGAYMHRYVTVGKPVAPALSPAMEPERVSARA